MSKEHVVNSKLDLIDWVISLRSISDHIWFKPFKEGSWGTADVISHFISWDKFMIEHRLNYLLQNQPFPNFSIDAQAMNNKASEYARSGISKDELIDEFISVRQQLVSLINQFPTEIFDQPCPGKEHLTLNQYFDGMIEHDLKHKNQIDLFLSMT